jgi:hypothetical protein
MYRNLDDLFSSTLFRDSFHLLQIFLRKIPIPSFQFFGFEIDLLSNKYTSDLLFELKPSTASWYPNDYFLDLGPTGLEINNYLSKFPALSPNSYTPRNLWIEFDFRDTSLPTSQVFEPSVFVGPCTSLPWSHIFSFNQVIPQLLKRKSLSIPRLLIERISFLESIFGPPIQIGFMSSRLRPTYRAVFKLPEQYSFLSLSKEFHEFTYCLDIFELFDKLDSVFDSSCLALEFDLDGVLLPNFGLEYYNTWFDQQSLIRCCSVLSDLFLLCQDKLDLLIGSTVLFKAPSDIVIKTSTANLVYHTLFTQVFNHHFKIGVSPSRLTLKTYLGVISPQLIFDSLGNLAVADSLPAIDRV